MRSIKKGATSQSLYFDVLDSSSTTGGRKTGLAYNTSSLTAYYVRNGASSTAITLATLAAANSAWSSGGFKEVDATNMPGVYRLDVPDAAFASGADSVVVTIKGASGMVQASYDVQLVDNLASDVYSRIGAPVGASISADIAGVQADTDNIQTRLPAALVSGRMDASVGAMANDVITSAAIATDAIGSAELAASAVTEIQSGLSTLDASGVRAAVGLASANLDTQLSTISGYIDTEVAAIKAKTDNLPSDPADASDIAAAFSTVNSTLATIAGYVDTEVAAIKAKTDNLPTDPADASDIAAAFASLQSHGDITWATADVSDLPTNAELATALAGADDATLAAIAGLNNLSAADVNAQVDIALSDAGVTTVRMGHLDADVSSRLAASSYTAPDDTAVLAAIGGLNDLSAAEVNAEVDTAIAEAALATAANLATTNGKVDAVKSKTDSLTFTVSGQVDANMQSINDTLLTGDGSAGDKFGPA